MSPISPQRSSPEPEEGATSSPAALRPPLTAADREQPFWFGPAEAPLFGMYHPPLPSRAADAPRRRLAIALCAPFGYEAMCAHRPYRKLAEQLSDLGFPVLRFDYQGTGSSAGDDREPRRVAAWLRSVQIALDELRDLSGCSQLAMFGARFGAIMAALAAESREDVGALALWGPPLTGKVFLREELAVHKLQAQQRAARTARPVTADHHDEVLGFVLSAETTRELQALDLAKLKRGPASALVLARETALQEPRVAKRLEDLGTRVSYEQAPGYTAMLDSSLPPEAVWQRVAGYFDACDRELGDDLPPAAASGGARPAEVRLGPAVRETACWFGPDRRLFGVLTEHASKQRTGAPMLLLLSGGVNPQVGTNRLHTRWARAWAELGFRSFRFDLAGIGDSGARPGEQDGELYTMAGIADVCAAMDHLGVTCGAREFMLIGLCSGAFVAFHTALADPRVSHIGLLNLLRFYWDPNDSIERVQAQRRRQLRSVRYYLDAATRREHWEKLLRGRVDLPRILEHLASRAARRTLHAAAYRLGRLTGTPVPAFAAHPLARDFRALAKRGVRSLVVYDGDEPMLDDFREQLGPEKPRLEEQGSLHVEVIDGADHIFSPIASQEILTERLTRYLQTRLPGGARP